MKTFKVCRDIDWKSFSARAGQTITDADLKTEDGQPLPRDVVSIWRHNGALVEVIETAASGQ